MAVARPHDHRSRDVTELSRYVHKKMTTSHISDDAKRISADYPSGKEPAAVTYSVERFSYV
jgi:hypothetical protein